MSRRRSFLALPALALLLATPRPARPQQAVSPELLGMLARAALPLEDSVEVVTDALPPGWTARMPLPAGMRFVGAVLGRSAAVAYLVSAAPPVGARGLARAAAQSAGYVEAPERRPMGGPLLRQQSPLLERPLCRGATEVLGVQVRQQLTATLVTLSYRSGPAPACEPSRPELRPDAFSVLPQLQPPPLPAGARLGGCFGARSSGGSGTEVMTTLELAGVLRFYGAQLEAAGWRREPGDSATAGTWRKATGPDTATALLVVSGPASAVVGCRRLQLELRQNYPPR